MKKKTRQRFLYLLWILVALAGLALWLIPPRYAPPRFVWRAPVGFQVPSISLPDVTLNEAIGEDVRDVLQDVLKAPEPEIEPITPYEEEVEPTEPASQPKPAAQLPPLPKGEHPLIALIIDDMGIVPSLSARAVRLPTPVTLSYLPYASGLAAQVKEAKERGHEIMLHLPMEPLGSEKPGAGALLTAMEDEEIRQKTIEALNSFHGFRGVNNHMGSKFTLNRNKMDVVVKVLHEWGVYFVDSRTSPRAVGVDAAQAAGVPTIGRDVFLDDVRTPQAIRGELSRLESLARRKGQAVAIGHPHVLTLQALEDWIPQAEAKGYRFVPVSEIVR